MLTIQNGILSNKEHHHVEVVFDAGGDSLASFYAVNDKTGDVDVLTIRRVTFTDERETMYYLIDETGNAVTPAMPEVAIQVVINAKVARFSEFLEAIR